MKFILLFTIIILIQSNFGFSKKLSVVQEEIKRQNWLKYDIKDNLPQILDGNASDLLQLCKDQSICQIQNTCYQQLDVCSKCQNNSKQKEGQYQATLNKNMYECYKDCLNYEFKLNKKEKVNTDSQKQYISEETFEILICLKKAIFNTQKYQVMKSVNTSQSSIKEYFNDQPDWKIQVNQSQTEWDFKWYRTAKKSQRVTISKFGKYQIRNRIPSMINYIKDKINFQGLLRDFDLDQNGKYRLNSSQFVPKWYYIDFIDPKRSELEIQKMNEQKDTQWIVKDPVGQSGQGIRIIEGLAEVNKELKIQQELSLRQQKLLKQGGKLKKGEELLERTLVQKYIDNPMLTNKKKFDLRVFTIVLGTDPLFVVYKHAFSRRTLMDYDPSITPWDTETQIRHLTNMVVQKLHPNFNDPGTKESYGTTNLEEFESLKKEHNFNDEQIEDMKQQIKQITTYVHLSLKSKTEITPGTFQFVATDFMIDEDRKVQLLESNSYPATYLNVNTKIDQIKATVNYQMLDMAVNILGVQDIEDRYRMLQNPDKYFNLHSWEILLNEASGYDYLSDSENNSYNKNQNNIKQEKKQTHKTEEL